MIRSRLVVSLMAFALLLAAPAAAQDAPEGAGDVITMRASLLLPSWGGYTLSPDGRRVAFTRSVRDTTDFESVSHVFVLDVATGETRQLTTSEKGESNPRWLPDGRLLFSSNRDGKDRLWVISPDGGEARRYLEDDEAPGGTFSRDYTRIAFTEESERPDKEEWEGKVERKDDAYYHERKLTYRHVFVYDVASGEKTQLTSGEFDHGGPTWSPDGRWVAYSSNRTGTRMGDPDQSNNSDVFVVPADGGPERRLTTNAGPDSRPVFSPDGRWIAYSSSDRENHRADQSDVKVVALEGGEPVNLTADFDYSVGGFDFSPDGRHIYFDASRGLGSQLYRVPLSGGAPEAVFPEDGYVYRVVDRTEDWSTWLVTGSNLSDPGSVFLADSRGENLRRILRENDGLEGYRLATAETLAWKGADGWEIEGILTYPLGYREGQRVPLILQVHGGPHGRFSHTFNTGAQIWAARGYAVLQGNPRGSSGRTLEFSQANVQDWGGKDFEDLMKGVDHVVAMGVADPDRLAIMGGSYGGFMTFWAVSQTDRFKAAIGHAGISDWYPFYGETDIPDLLEFGFGGNPWETQRVYDRFSPLRYAENVTTPLLITHGEEDLRVPITQADKYFRWLKKMGKTVEFLRFPREGHGIREPRHRLHLDAEQAAWLERWLGGTGARVTTDRGGAGR